MNLTAEDCFEALRSASTVSSDLDMSISGQERGQIWTAAYITFYPEALAHCLHACVGAAGTKGGFHLETRQQAPTEEKSQTFSNSFMFKTTTQSCTSISLVCFVFLY